MSPISHPMSTTKDFTEVLELILKEDTRFEKGAYFFVREALDFTMKLEKKEIKKDPRGNHVSGQQLLEGIRQFAIEQFGPMTITVFDEWGITKCNDFGDIVFNLVEYGILGKTEDDQKEDFAGGYDFHEVFDKPFLPEKSVANGSKSNEKN